jgi:hypothetical protein
MKKKIWKVPFMKRRRKKRKITKPWSSYKGQDNKKDTDREELTVIDTYLHTCTIHFKIPTTRVDSIILP